MAQRKQEIPPRPARTRPPKETPGVLVLRSSTRQGDTLVEVREIGGLDPLAVPTLLRLAANIKEQGFQSRGD